MVETGHNHGPPPPPPPMDPPLGSARGPIYQPVEQFQALDFCIHSNPSWLETVLLAFQHYIVMLGSTVLIATTLVPPMGGTHSDLGHVIQTLVFMAGINTLLQTLIGARLPTVMGPSFAFLIAAMSIVNDDVDVDLVNGHQRFIHSMKTIQGSLIVSSFINIILGYSNVWGYFARFLSPIVIVPFVSVVGPGLSMRGFPQVANCIDFGLPMLLMVIISQQYLKHFHSHAEAFLQRYTLLVCIALIWSFAAILTVSGAYNNVSDTRQRSCRTDRTYLLSTVPWIKVPYPFQWGAPIFKAGHVFAMMGAALVSSAETTGTFYAAARLSGATPPPPHVLSRSIGLQGISMLLDGIFGAAVGTTASVENVGLLGSTRIGSRRVVQISSAFMIFFSIFGKFGAFFASIPLPIFAAIYCILFGFVAASGVSLIQFANPNSPRNLYILGLSLFLGVSISQYFVTNTDNYGHGPVKTGGGWFNDFLHTIFSSAPTVTLLGGALLDNTMEPLKHVGDRGVPWWPPYMHPNRDVGNEEFYKYPWESPARPDPFDDEIGPDPFDDELKVDSVPNKSGSDCSSGDDRVPCGLPRGVPWWPPHGDSCRPVYILDELEPDPVLIDILDELEPDPIKSDSDYSSGGRGVPCGLFICTEIRC